MRRNARIAVTMTLAFGAATPAARADTSPTTPDTEAPVADATPTEQTVAKVDPFRAPAAGKSALAGVVRDDKTNEPLADAVITVLESKMATVADEEGRYRLELPKGTYTLRVVSEFHKVTRVSSVRIGKPGLVRLDIRVRPDEDAIDEATQVEAEVERASASTQLLLRRNAGAAQDAVGAQDIARTPDRNAADAVRRVVGATVENNRYVVVRGLGDRYTNSMLGGSPLPSPEPDRQAVPLDMFPTLVLSDLVIRKTFTPDMPGDFAGGSLDIHTREMPGEFLLAGSLSAGLNSESTFKGRLGYPGGKFDWLGIDDGGRKLPRSVPDSRVSRLRPDGTVNPDLTALGRDINGPMESERVFNLPSGSGNIVLGDSYKVGKEGRIGYVLGAGYSRRFQNRNDETIRTYYVDTQRPGQLIRANDYRAETGSDTVTWSTLGTVGYTINKDHRLTGTGLYSRNAEKEARVIEGFNDDQQAEIRDERLRFINRQLMYTQLRGEHRLPDLGRGTLEWRLVWARATLTDPNLRETVYQRDAETGYSFRESTQSGQHFYANQGETTRSAGLDWSQPVVKDVERPKLLKVGGSAALRGRSFTARRFRFLRTPGAPNEVFRQRPDALFVDENIGPALELTEATQPTDTYDATYNVFAGYAMGDLAVTDRLRFVFGERIESSKQTIDSFDPLDPAAQGAQSSLVRTDLLPAASAVFKVRSDVSVRASATQTVARPQLRELAPFIFSDFLGARETLGNPQLDRTKIVNLDARVEFYPAPTEVLALSVFHKEFKKPIEPVIIPTSRGVLSYQNADGATNTGIELEARKKLGFVHRVLTPFTFLGNFTVLYSRVALDRSKVGLLTNAERPLAGQSPFVLNAAIDYERESTGTRVRLLYNVLGARIAQVGLAGLPDTYEQPRHLVDLAIAQSVSKHLDVKATIENVLDAPYRFTVGDDQSAETANRWTIGRSVWLTATYTH